MVKKILSVIFGLAFFALIFTCLYFIFKEPIDNIIGKWKIKEVTINYCIMDPDTSNYNIEKEIIYLEKGQDYKIEEQELEYYVINYDKSNLVVFNIQNDITLSIYYDCETCEVTFDPNGGDTSEALTFTVNKGSSFKAPLITMPHYSIKEYVGYVSKIYEDSSFTVIWEETKYLITLVLPSGCYIDEENYYPYVNNTNYYTYITYFEELELPNVLSDEYNFLYFVNENEEETYILRDIEEDLYLIGKFTEQLYTITFSSDYSITPIVAASGDHINAPKMSAGLIAAGYDINWYIDSQYEELFDFYLMPNYDLVLYGRVEPDTLTGFLEYDIEKETIDSIHDFTKCIDYVYFNYVTDGLRKKVTYTTFNEINEEFQKASRLAEYRSNTELNMRAEATNALGSQEVYVTLSLQVDTSSFEGTMTAARNGKEILDYVDYHPTYNLRDVDFNDFYIENLPKTYNVSTTNQLLYVVEHGYKPICSGKALDIYNKAKAILRDIISDDMNDLEKIEAIYKYLVANVQYDHLVLSAPNTWEHYDSYFMEGVFNNQKAVCDGIAKSLVLLCNIEGIKCVEVSGNNHAWCEVKINNRWYVIDATHGNLGVSGYEFTVFDFSEFLISQATKQEKGYTSHEFENIRCEKDFNYLRYKTVTFNDEELSFVVHNADDLEKLFEYAVYKRNGTDDISFNFIYDSDISLDLLITSAKNLYRLSTLHFFPGTTLFIPNAYDRGTIIKLIIS